MWQQAAFAFCRRSPASGAAYDETKERSTSAATAVWPNPFPLAHPGFILCQEYSRAASMSNRGKYAKRGEEYRHPIT